MPVLLQLSLAVVIALLFAFIMRILRQPLIVGYILTGILIGPYGLNLIHTNDTFQIFAKIGIIIVLFIVGLNLSPTVIRDLGKISLFTGLSQIAVTSVVGYFLGRALGIDQISALYISIAFTFSSTIIILKLISDKGDLHTLYGKITIGFLLVQDMVATLILLVATAARTGSAEGLLMASMITLVKGVVMTVALFAMSHYVFPHLGEIIASSQEMLFLFTLGWGMGMATLFYVIGYSLEIGALVAGVTISTTPYAYEAAARLRPLRDFFILLFFILLGSQMTFMHLDKLIIPAIFFTLFILIGEPVIMIIIMNLLGFSRRTSFQTSMTVAQISEFSLILATLGFELGHLSGDMLSLITLVGLCTIGVSAYLIMYSDSIFPHIEKLLVFLEFRQNKSEHMRNNRYDSILFGYNRVGEDFIEAFHNLDLHSLVVDMNPQTIDRLKKEGVSHMYGDANDAEFLNELNLHKVKYVASTIGDFDTNIQLVRRIRAVNKRAVIVTVAQTRDESLALYAEGATYVVMPHYLGAQYAVRLMSRHGTDSHHYSSLRERHLAYLEKRIV